MFVNIDMLQAFDGTDVVISGNQDKDGGLNLGLSLKPNKFTEEGRKKKNKGETV